MARPVTPHESIRAMNVDQTRPMLPRFERRLCRRTLGTILGEVSEGAVEAPSDGDDREVARAALVRLGQGTA
jgi:hypothetical protein